MGDIDALVAEAGRRAGAGAASLAAASDATIDAVLTEAAERLAAAVDPVLAANAADVEAADAAGMGTGLLDRLRLTPGRVTGMADQLRALAAVPYPARSVFVRDLPGGLRVDEVRLPVGVIGANYEARPNVTVDVAAQLLKSRNGGVLRTGGAALRSAEALLDHVVAPALAAHGLDPDAIQLLRTADRAAARALVAQPRLIPLVILRGSGESTRELALAAATHGVRTLQHADGGAVLFVHAAADPDRAVELLRTSLDRLGVCNRLNLLLLDSAAYDELSALLLPVLAELGVRAALPPYDRPRGHEWALDDGNEATVTISPADGPADAARIANEDTSGLAAGIVTTDDKAAREFLTAYRGTGAFWNATTRLLDGYKLLGVSETGINIDRVPGPRGPVTFADLCLRQYVVTPAGPR